MGPEGHWCAGWRPSLLLGSLWVLMDEGGSTETLDRRLVINWSDNISEAKFCSDLRAFGVYLPNRIEPLAGIP